MRRLNLIHIILLIIDVCIGPIVGFFQGFDSPNAYIAILITILIGHPMIYLILMVIKASMIDDYEASQYMPLCMVLTVLFGCLIWYVFFHTTFVFSQTIWLWYSMLLLAFALPYIVYKIVLFISEKRKKKNTPKIIRRK